MRTVTPSASKESTPVPKKTKKTTTASKEKDCEETHENKRPRLGPRHRKKRQVMAYHAKNKSRGHEKDK